jgi:uncharacterized cupin superfamily protein
MADATKPVVTIADVALQEQSHGKSFLVKSGRIGRTLGLASLGISVIVVPPGKRAWPFHRHHITEEAFVILSGSGEYRYGKDTYPVKAGDIIAAPAGGEAHQLINTGSEDLRYLGLSAAHGGVDIVEYPDTGKIGLVAGVKPGGDFRSATYAGMGTLTPQDYWEGED